MIEPIATIAINSAYSKQVPIEPSPMISWVFQALGIPMTTTTIILVMFAGWGIWHWVLMGINAKQGLPNFIKIVKGYLNKRPEHD
jgi:hypothetical protein